MMDKFLIGLGWFLIGYMLGEYIGVIRFTIKLLKEWKKK